MGIWNWRSIFTEDYYDYQTRIKREMELNKIRGPVPKVAVCSSRRRGRKFRGS